MAKKNWTATLGPWSWLSVPRASQRQMLSFCLVGALPNNENTKITWYPLSLQGDTFIYILLFNASLLWAFFQQYSINILCWCVEKSKLCWQTKLDINMYMCTFCVALSKKRPCIGIALSVCPLVITLPFFLIFLHQTFKLYCCWQHRHKDGSCFMSRSHFSEFSPFSTWILSRKLNEGYLCQILIFLHQTFKW